MDCLVCLDEPANEAGFILDTIPTCLDCLDCLLPSLTTEALEHLLPIKN